VRLRGNFDVRAVALPIMETLRDRLGETVNLTIREEDQVVYVEKATPNGMIRVQQLVGTRAPLLVTAVGKLMRGAAARRASAPMPSVPTSPPTPATPLATCHGSSPNAPTPWTTRRRRSTWAASGSFCTTRRVT
jgi:DNA-binding IclR family transcriptional regulator